MRHKHKQGKPINKKARAAIAQIIGNCSTVKSAQSLLASNSVNVSYPTLLGICKEFGIQKKIGRPKTK